MTADDIKRRAAALGLPAPDERLAASLAEEVSRLEGTARKAAARHDLLWCSPADFERALERSKGP